MSYPEVQPNEINDLPMLDHLPQVSFDIRLGQQLSRIDFNYEGYTEHMAAQGLTPQQIAETKIAFIPFNLRGASAGSYNPVTEKVTVKLPPIHTESFGNKVLAHESKHRADFLQDKYTAMDEKTNNIRSVAMVRSLKAASLGVGIEYLGGHGLLDQEAYYVGKYFALGSLGISFMTFLGYRFSGSERRARKAGRAATNILSVESLQK